MSKPPKRRNVLSPAFRQKPRSRSQYSELKKAATKDWERDFFQGILIRLAGQSHTAMASEVGMERANFQRKLRELGLLLQDEQVA